MRFKTWLLQNEIQLNPGKNPSVDEPNPTQAGQMTRDMAKNTLSKFGTNVVQGISSAPNPQKAGKIAVDFAQKAMSKSPQQGDSNTTNPLAVGAQVYKQATGQDMKMMGKE